MIITVIPNQTPIINHPADIIYMFGQTGHVITWTITDASTSTRIYIIYRNGSTFASGYWTSGNPMTYGVDFPVGSYNFTIVATDGLGGTVQDSVIVTVLNIAPSITHPADITYIAGQTGNIIFWTITSTSTGNRAYTFSRNDTTIATGTWTSGTPVSQNIDELPIGSHNFTIIATVAFCGVVQDTVIVTVLNDAPSITHPADITYISGQRGNRISWTITDTCTGTCAYSIYKNGISYANGSWTSGSPISSRIDYFSPGSYNMTIVATDGLGGSVQDNVIVTVNPNLAPTVTHPADITYDIGQTGHVISWIVTDATTGTRQYTIFRNGTDYVNGNWTSGIPVTCNVDYMFLGHYIFAISAYDGLNCQVNDYVIVTITNTAPTLTHPADITYTFGQVGHVISWAITDISTSTHAYTINRNGTFIANGTWTSGIPVLQNVDGLAIGKYLYRILVIDGFGGSSQDEILVTVVLNTLPTFLCTVSRDNAIISWVITDSSTSITTYTIYRNRTAIDSGPWQSGVPVTASLSDLVPGVYNFTIVAMDGLGGQVRSTALAVVAAIPPKQDPTIIIVIIFACCGIAITSTLTIKYRTSARKNNARIASVDAIDVEPMEEAMNLGTHAPLASAKEIAHITRIQCHRCGNESSSDPGKNSRCAFCGEPL